MKSCYCGMRHVSGGPRLALCARLGARGATGGTATHVVTRGAYRVLVAPLGNVQPRLAPQRYGAAWGEGGRPHPPPTARRVGRRRRRANGHGCPTGGRRRTVLVGGFTGVRIGGRPCQGGWRRLWRQRRRRRGWLPAGDRTDGAGATAAVAPPTDRQRWPGAAGRATTASAEGIADAARQSRQWEALNGAGGAPDHGLVGGQSARVATRQRCLIPPPAAAVARRRSAVDGARLPTPGTVWGFARRGFLPAPPPVTEWDGAHRGRWERGRSTSSRRPPPLLPIPKTSRPPPQGASDHAGTAQTRSAAPRVCHTAPPTVPLRRPSRRWGPRVAVPRRRSPRPTRPSRGRTRGGRPPPRPRAVAAARGGGGGGGGGATGGRLGRRRGRHAPPQRGQPRRRPARVATATRRPPRVEVACRPTVVGSNKKGLCRVARFDTLQSWSVKELVDNPLALSGYTFAQFALQFDPLLPL